jgi:hypothetical protein
MDTVKSRIASFEAQNNQVRFSPVKSPQGDGSPQSSGYDSPNGLYGNPQQPQLTPLDAIGCNSTNPFSPERPLSTTSFASQNRINRLQRQAAAGVGANTSNTSAASTAASTAASSNSSATTDLPVPVPHTKPGLRAPQPPDSQGGSSLAQMRQTARERRLTGAQANPKGGMPSSPAPSASLFAHHRQQPGTSNTARATSPVRDSVNSESIGNSNSNMELKSPPRTGLQSRTLANAKRRTRSNISSTSNGQSNSSSRLETPTPTKVPARTATASTVVSGAVDSDPKDSSMRMREMDRPSEEEKSMARKSRMEKVERIKKKRSLDTVRRRKKPGSSSSSGQHKPAAQQQQQQHASSFAEDPAMMLSPTTVQAVPSVDHATDDEMTLTSVRQIVGNDDYFESPKASVFAEEDLSPKPRGDYGHQSSSRLWMENMEEKSEKDDPVRGIMIAPSSSSEYDTDGDENSRIASALYDEGGVAQDPSLSVVSSSQVTPAEAALLGKNRQKNSRKGTQALGNTTGTFDYGERDEEGSVVSLSYEQRRQKEVKEKEARNAAVAAAKAKMDDGPFVQTEDVEHYRKTLSTPIAKTAMGVAGAATLGCILLGPVGLLVGAAVVGIGIGAMQIPEEQRSHMQDKASETMKSAQESAFNASETFSSSCASKCKDSGVSEHFPSEMESCFGGGGKDETGVSEKNEKLVDELNTYASYQALDPSGPNIMDGRKVPSPSRNGRVRDQKETVACLQEGTCLQYTLRWC